MCRREGVSLCGRAKCALNRRPYPPGQHGQNRAHRNKMSSFGIQLREKQKARRLYNVLEKPFRRYVEEALTKTGNTTETLVQLLERRLDNTVYRIGIAQTRAQARQMVSHGFIEVNEQKVDIASYRVAIGDTIKVRSSKLKKGVVSSSKEQMTQKVVPSWLSVDPATLSGKVTSTPMGEDLKQVFDPTLIVEYYSR